MRKRHELETSSGFTLVELLVTIAIIGILAGIAVPLYLGQRAKAMHNEAKVNLEAIRLLEEQFFAEKGEYAPDDILGTASLVPINGVANIQAKLSGFKPGDTASLKFEYYLDYTVVNAVTTGYRARAIGKGDTPVAGATFSIDQDNVKNW